MPPLMPLTFYLHTSYLLPCYNKNQTVLKNLGILLKIAVIALFLVACQKPQEVVILHTNDTHSQLEPYKEKNGSIRGGVLRRMEFVEHERKGDAPVFLFDAGDFSQGTPYYNLFEGYPEIDFMNRMGYDAATLGNHEFDEGTQHLADRLKTAKFPIVCCNYTIDNPDLAAQVKPYTIIERNGLKMGVFGVVIQLDGLLATEHIMDTIHYIDAVEASREVVQELKKLHCDIIVCLSHLGFGPDDVAPDRPMCDTLLAREVQDIDLIIGGHSHLETDTLIGRVRVVSNINQGRTVGKMTMRVKSIR